jgi:hypothetical protein
LQFLPDLARWGDVIAGFLQSGGVCYVVEGHPLISFIEDDERTVRGNYFTRDAIPLDEGTYTGSDSALTSSRSVEWIHHTAEVVSALGGARTPGRVLHEHDRMWYPLLPVLQQQGDRWMFGDDQPKLPLQYSLRAVRD